VKQLEESAIRAFNALGLDDYAVLDFRVDENGLPYLLEINMVGSFGPKSVVSVMAKEIGISFDDLFHQMATNAIKRHQQKTKSRK